MVPPRIVTVMGTHESPTEEEKERFEELYGELGSARKVAEHEDVDWSRATVSKWLKRRGVMSSPGSENPEEGVSEEPDPEGSDVETAVQQAPDPNDILRRVVRKDPGLGDDELDWLEGYIEDYGVLSSNDVQVALDQLKFTNKNMTISRVTTRYVETVNRVLRENPHLQWEEPWSTLLTKETGQPYNQSPQGYQQPNGGQGASMSAPPAGRGQMGGNQQQSQIAPPPGGREAPDREQEPGQRGQQPNRQNPQQGAIQPPQQQPYGRQPPRQPPQQQQQEDDGMSPLEEFAMEMLRDQMSGNDTEQKQPEPKGSDIDKIRELRELREEFESLTGADQDDTDDSDKFEQMMSAFEQRMSQLEAQISQQESQSQTPTQSFTGGGEDSGPGLDLAGIASLADSIDDPELIEMAVKMQTDPDVIKAEIEREKAMNEGQWKSAVFESLSPAATEKAVDALSSLATGVLEAGRSGQQQAAAQQQQQQGNTQTLDQRMEQQGGQRQGDVEVVEQAEPEQQGPTRESTSVSGSPMRQKNTQPDEAESESEDVEVAEEDPEPVAEDDVDGDEGVSEE